MKSVKEVLVEARKLIDTPEKWSKGAGDDNCHCAIGALTMVAIERNLSFWPARDALVEILGPESSVVVWNDAPTTTHADVMALFDRAIAACDAEGTR